MNVTELPKVDPKSKVTGDSDATGANRGNILIVDDNPENLRALKLILEEQKYHVRAAISGQLALDSMRLELPELVLLDIMMPGKNGYEVCEEIKANDATKDIPVLFISALDDLSEKMKAFSVGGVDYIPKPFYAHEVLARVNTHINLYKSQRELQDANRQLVDRSKSLELANNELNSFSYSVSHDLRAPLRSISGFSQILLEDFSDSLDEVATEHVNTIIRNAKHMEQLIDDLLQLSRISQSEFVVSRVNLSDTVSRAWHSILQSPENHNVNFKVKENVWASCSPKLAGIAISNLLNNAWKYSQYVENPIIEFGADEKEGKETFFIRDNGIGFEMKYAKKIFLPFHRLHRDDKYEGSGIGLATVKKIFDVHHGEIWVDSEPSQGTTFYFRFE